MPPLAQRRTRLSRAAAARSATFTIWATGWSSSPPIASAPSTGCCRRGIPDKGRVLTALTLFWLDHLGVPNHLLSTDPADMGPAFAATAAELDGRTAWCARLGRADRMRGPRLPGRLRLEGISSSRHGLRHAAASGLRQAPDCPSRSSRRPRRRRAATIRTSPLTKWPAHRC